MKIIHQTFLLTMFILITSCNSKSNSTTNLPLQFKNSIPTILNDGLKLVEVKTRCDGCQPWRYIDYYSNDSKKPIKSEKVTVKAGYRAMYTYPDTHYFSNTKIEQSAKGMYEQDKNIVIDAIKHDFNRKKELVYGYLKENPSLKEKVAPSKAKGKDYIELEENTYKGYKYISYTENVIGLTGNTISQLHIFVPENEIIVTAYLLNQKKAKFKTIDEFLKLRREFITSYINFVSKKKASSK